MKSARSFHAIGAWLLIVMGLAHLAARIHFELSEHTPEHQQALEVMGATPLAAGSAVSFADVFAGMSSSFTLFALLTGLLALVIGRRAADRLDVLQPVRIVLVVFLAIEAVISIRYFIPPPTVFLSVAALCFLISAIVSRRG